MFNDDNAGGWVEEKEEDKQVGNTGKSMAKNSGVKPYLPITCKEMQNVLPNEGKITIGSKEFFNTHLIAKCLKGVVESGQLKLTLFDEDNPNFTVTVHVFKAPGATLTYDLAEFEGQYVSAFGKFRAFDGVPSIIAYCVRPVNSDMEVKAHKKEVELAQLFYEKDILGRISKGTLYDHEETCFGQLQTNRHNSQSAVSTNVNGRDFRVDYHQQQRNSLPHDLDDGAMTEIYAFFQSRGPMAKIKAMDVVNHLPHLNKQQVEDIISKIVEKAYMYENERIKNEDIAYTLVNDY